MMGEKEYLRSITFTCDMAFNRNNDFFLINLFPLEENNSNMAGNIISKIVMIIGVYVFLLYGKDQIIILFL